MKHKEKHELVEIAIQVCKAKRYSTSFTTLIVFLIKNEINIDKLSEVYKEVMSYKVR